MKAGRATVSAASSHQIAEERLFEEQADASAVCNPFLYRDGLRVNVGRALHSRVSQRTLVVP